MKGLFNVVVVVLLSTLTFSQAFLVQRSRCQTFQQARSNLIVTRVRADRFDIFSPGSAHPETYLPGSPYQAKKNPSSFRDKIGPKEDLPSTLSADRSEVFHPMRPDASHITRTSQMRSSSFPTSLEVDTPGHFQSGNAFVSGSLARQDYSQKAPPSPANRNFAIESFSVDRPDIYRPIRPHESSTQPIRRSNPPLTSKAVPNSKPGDRSEAFRPVRSARTSINESRPSKRPTSFEPDHPDAFRPVRPVADQPKTAIDKERPSYLPTSFEADVPGHFQTGSAFGRGSAMHPTAWNPNKKRDIRPPSSLSVDHLGAFTAASTRPASSRPSRTSQQLGLASEYPSSFKVDEPGAFNPGPNWKK